MDVGAVSVDVPVIDGTVLVPVEVTSTVVVVGVTTTVVEVTVLVTLYVCVEIFRIDEQYFDAEGAAFAALTTTFSSLHSSVDIFAGERGVAWATDSSRATLERRMLAVDVQNEVHKARRPHFRKITLS